MFLLIVLSTFLFACTGDCIACHPILKKSINKPYHQILKSCITCHKDNAGPVNECGGDCFKCHPREKLINSNRVEHQEISKCKECHIDVNELLNNKKQLNQNDDLIDILKK